MIYRLVIDILYLFYKLHDLYYDENYNCVVYGVYFICIIENLVK